MEACFARSCGRCRRPEPQVCLVLTHVSSQADRKQLVIVMLVRSLPCEGTHEQLRRPIRMWTKDLLVITYPSIVVIRDEPKHRRNAVAHGGEPDMRDDEYRAACECKRAVLSHAALRCNRVIRG
jgi:hypothetical protein